GSTSVLGALSITGTAKFDLTSKAIIINYTSGSPIASIKLALSNGYAGGAWNGNGINSSTAAAQANSNNRTAMGFAQASEIFSSFPATFAGVDGVDNTSVLILYTAYGDANLDKTVDTSDFNILAANFGGTGKRWSQGDFNYDGACDTLDFNALAANFSFTV